MGILTPFFNLFKPAKTDPQAISKINENMDIIDTEMHKPPLTVNNVDPDPDTRDIHIETVPLADNLTSDEAQLNQGTFIERTSGGDASISDGSASISSIKGNMVHTGYVPEVLNMTVNAATRVPPAAITATLDEATFEAYVETAGTYTLTYDDDAWDEDPADYGVTISNDPVDGDSITIVWDGENDAVMTVNAVPRVAPPAITATIDRDTFVAYVAASGTITLNYTTAWSADPENYGITVTNEPVAGDQIVVVYVKLDRGTITPASPTSFNSTGWNLYDKANGYAKVVKYSTTLGFRIEGSFSLLSFAPTLNGTQSALTQEDGYFMIPSDGYVFVTGGDATTCIYATWSDWIDGYEGDFESYTCATISLTTVMANFPYGLLAIGNTKDEINFNTQKAYSRVQRIAYSDAAMETVIASGLPYDADTNYIYVVRASVVEYDIEVDPVYTVSDHGIEFYIAGTSTPIETETLYGENLKDLLRHDLPERITENAQAIALERATGGIVQDGNTATQAISAGEFVNWKGYLYTADSAISVGATFAASGAGKNLTAVSKGGFNALNSNIDSITGYGSNSNGTYWKFKDGTMICAKKVTATKDMTVANGSLYTHSGSISLGNWPDAFTSVPFVNVTNVSASGYWVDDFASGNTPSATNAGKVFLTRATSQAGVSITLNVIGIGRWK